MRLLVTLVLAFGFVSHAALSQGAQADLIKRRAKELNNQNNVRQGVTPPSQASARQRAAPPVAPALARTAPASPATLQQQNISKLSADFATLKLGTASKPDQKQRLIKDLTAAVRGTKKPSPSSVTKFANSLTEALREKGLDPAGQTRLARNVEAVLNSEQLPPAQFDAIIGDVQAILQVAGAKRNLAVNAANDLKAVGAEVRKAPAK